MFSASGLRAIIRTTLLEIDLWSVDAEELLLGTAAKESRLGKWLHQIGGGPARGVFQIEITNEADIWKNFLAFRPELKKIVTYVTGVHGPDPEQLTYNPVYGTALARCHYLRIKEPLPKSYNIPAAAEYWDRYFNRNSAVGFPEEYIENYYSLILH